MVLNKLSKAARGKSNKAYENAASISKMPFRTSPCSKYLIPKFNTNTFKTYSSSTEKKSYEMFLFYCFRKMLLLWKREGYHCVVLFWLVCTQF